MKINKEVNLYIKKIGFTDVYALMLIFMEYPEKREDNIVAADGTGILIKVSKKKEVLENIVRLFRAYKKGEELHNILARNGDSYREPLEQIKSKILEHL